MGKQVSMWTCEYCGQDTSNTDVEYLSGFNHLACELERENKNKVGTKDCCVMCGKETAYNYETNINYRYGYVEGIGQLCKRCYDKGTDRRLVTIPAYIIEDSLDDAELGAKVREFYRDFIN